MAVHGLRRAPLMGGDTVAVLGAGVGPVEAGEVRREGKGNDDEEQRHEQRVGQEKGPYPFFRYEPFSATHQNLK